MFIVYTHFTLFMIMLNGTPAEIGSATRFVNQLMSPFNGQNSHMIRLT